MFDSDFYYSTTVVNNNCIPFYTNLHDYLNTIKKRQVFFKKNVVIFMFQNTIFIKEKGKKV